jgi:hypothetical protein
MWEFVEKFLTRAWKLYSDRFDENRYMPARFKEMAGLPQTVGVFDPFLSSRLKDSKVWPRPDDLKRFQDHVAKNIHSHMILVGSSGAGKTVFIEEIVQAEYPDAFILTSVYNEFLSTLINNIPCGTMFTDRTDLAREITDYINDEATASPIDLVLRQDEKFPDEDLRVLIEKTIDFIKKCLRGKPTTLFVFDQIERFVSDFRYAATHSEETKKVSEIFCLIQLLKALRELDNVRTVFVIRKDTLFDSIDFLSYSLNPPTESDHIFRNMYFTGITERNNQASAAIKASFAKADNVLSWTTISTFLRLSSPSLSNTFLIQLTGYMIEHFGHTEEVQKVIGTFKPEGAPEPLPAGKPKDLLPLFFDQLIAGFHKAHPGEVSYDILLLVMLTIAIENRETGDPITERRIARLAHIPKEDVAIVVKYLRKIGVVRPDATEKEIALRYAHDMLFDHIVESDSFTVRNDLNNVIARIAERRTPDEKLTKITRFGRVWRDATSTYNVGAIAVAAFIIYGGIISISSFGLDIDGISSAPACNVLYGFWSSVWQKITYVDSCQSLGQYYFAIYFMDSIWVAYIYKLDRGYFTYALAGRAVLRFVAQMLPVLGVTLGIAMSFTPVLSLVPLSAVGIVMAILLLIIGRRKDDIDNVFTKTNRAWGIRTLSNMLFTTLFLLLH